MNKSQAWLSVFTGISTGIISQIISGRSIPNAKELSLLRAAFKCKNESLYDPEMIAIITGTNRPRNENGKSYRGKHVLLTDELGVQVDAYCVKNGLTRNEASRTLIIMGLNITELFQEILKEAKTP